MLTDVIGKIFVRAHRLANLGAVASDLSGEHAWQCGGSRAWGQSSQSSPSDCCRKKAKAEGTFIALIFVDARQAFYAIFRKLVLSVVETDQAVVSLFEQLRIPLVAIEELKAIFATGPAMENSTQR